ncbi:NitT/TauT family transport system substrate-binding protein [Bosea sp. OAE752]|jgi:NitT/TauT family transport system substrate-binding protein|uniref:ABC transporter substrate-binding protein n=1 Tax=unclassified Bosea (in: a-proteobacteria) TaxID=2653178 RepID=UPI001152A13D
MQRFHISATGHSLNYLPEYVAARQGYFAEEGLEVTVSVPKPWDLVLDELGNGTADAVLGGIWVPSMFRGRGKHYVPFAQMAARAPLALLGRQPRASFSWRDLPGKVIAMKGSNGASVGLFVKLLLRENGIDPREVGFIQDLDGAMLSDLFRGGMADFLAIDYPNAAALELAGVGHVAAPLAIVGGDVPWSVYYAEGEASPERLDRQRRFMRGLGRGMEQVLAHDAREIAEFLAQTFPRLSPDLLVRLTNEYRACGMWTTPRIDAASYERWQRGIADGHLTAAPIPYDALIDARPAAPA